MARFTRTGEVEVGASTATWWELMRDIEQLSRKTLLKNSAKIYKDEVNVLHTGGSFACATIDEAYDAATQTRYTVKQIQYSVSDRAFPEYESGTKVYLRVGARVTSKSGYSIDVRVDGPDQHSVDGLANALTAVIENIIKDSGNDSQPTVSSPAVSRPVVSSQASSAPKTEKKSRFRRSVGFITTQPMAVQVVGGLIVVGVVALITWLVSH